MNYGGEEAVLAETQSLLELATIKFAALQQTLIQIEANMRKLEIYADPGAHEEPKIHGLEDEDGANKG